MAYQLLDVVQPRKMPDGKTAWHNIGVAFAEQGKGIRIVLRSMPIPTFNAKMQEIEVSFMLFPKRKNENREPLMPAPVEQPEPSSQPPAEQPQRRSDREDTPF